MINCRLESKNKGVLLSGTPFILRRYGLSVSLKICNLHWIISYNDRSFPNIATLVDLIKPFRRTIVKEKEYCAGRGGKGSVAGSSEILILCDRY